MKTAGSLSTFSKEIKLLIGSFIIVLSIGYFMGLSFVNETTEGHPAGIQEQYLGNESDMDAKVMKFKKSKREVLTLVHNHILSLSVIFFIVSLLVATTNLNKKWKHFLMIEPFVSLVLTFGGIYVLWMGYTWVKYIIMISGTLMTFSYLAAVVVILYELLKSRSKV